MVFPSVLAFTIRIGPQTLGRFLAIFKQNCIPHQPMSQTRKRPFSTHRSWDKRILRTPRVCSHVFTVNQSWRSIISQGCFHALCQKYVTCASEFICFWGRVTFLDKREHWNSKNVFQPTNSKEWAAPEITCTTPRITWTQPLFSDYSSVVLYSKAKTEWF